MTSLPLSPTGLRARPERLADQVAIEAGNGMAARPRVADLQRLGSAYVERGGPDHAPGASGPGLQGAECLPCQALPALGQWLSPRRMLSEPPESYFSARRPGILVGMKVTLSFLRHLFSFLGVLLHLLRYLLSFCWALPLPRAVTAAQLLAFQSQLAAELNRSSAPRKRHRAFSPAFRILWVVLSKFLNGWEELAHIMKPETVKHWHTRAFRV